MAPPWRATWNTTGKWVLFEDSSHMPHIEQPERFLAVVEGFLARTEA